mmetsp:Transcript_10713/g.21325  ORF Transcript_10713/g.21325 Transcript_10713/m.21325 type:complete len:326 (-) Transcript_10713:93-1070(-)
MKNLLFLGAIATLVNPRLLFCASTSTTLSVDPSVDKKTQRKNRRRVRRRRTRTFHELIKNSPMNDLIDNDSNETVAPKGSNDAGRIIGGTFATKGQFNYVAQFSRGSACGGMLIAPNIILTAAHCKGGFKSAYLGFYDYNSPYGREEIMIEDEIIHPDFNKDTFYADYMIVVLEKNSIYKPVCITNRQFLSQRDWIVTLGFGFLSPGGSLANKMHKVSVQYINNQECAGKYSKHNKQISNNMLCADSSNIGRDACQGDSGGPIIKATNRGHVAVGVVSWGIGCAQLPGVYSRISEAYYWINSLVGENGVSGKTGSLPQSCNWAKK